MMQATFVLLATLVGSAWSSSSYQNTAFQSVYQDFGKQYPSASQCLSSQSSSLWESRNTVIDTEPFISCSSDQQLDSSEQYLLQQLQDLADDDTTQFDNNPFRLSLVSSVSTSFVDSQLSDLAYVSQKSTVSDASTNGSPASLSTTSTISSNPSVAQPAETMNSEKQSSSTDTQATAQKPACPDNLTGTCPLIFVGAECYTSSMKCFCTHSASMGSSDMFMWSCVNSATSA